jgi:hypothetical protein
MSTNVPAMIAALNAVFTASPLLGAASPPVTVTDSAKVTAEPGVLTLWVGVDDIDTPNPVAANADSQWQPGPGRRGRTEQLAVHCVIQAKSGSDEVAPLRIAVANVLTACETVLGADPTLGGLLRNRDAAVTAAEWRVYPLTPGMAVRVMFTISATALITAP